MNFDKYLTVALLLFSGMSFAQTYKADLQDKSCAGFPKLNVGTFPNSCLGLVADSKTVDPRTKESFRFPRKIVELAKNRFIVSDMGGWVAKRGGLWELDLTGEKPQLYKIVSGLSLVHDLEWGPDQELYVGELGRIVRYSREDLLNRKSPRAEVVVQGLPTNLKEINLHPLVNFAFGKSSQDSWDLYVNTGAPTDACTKEAPKKCSIDGTQAVIRHYIYRSGVNRWDENFEVYAKGLRNSMGLVTHDSGTLLQAENGRDFNDESEPFEEINVIKKGLHYGWPYCYDFQATSPEWKSSVRCAKDFEPPLILLPPHSAPLDLMYYHGKMFPDLEGHLLVTLHGYRPTGSRVVEFPTDQMGLPVWKNSNSWTYSFGKEKKQAEPDGGNLRSAEYQEVIASWWKRDEIRPSGTPVGMTVASDGSIFIVEDRNKTIVRLARASGQSDNSEDDTGEDKAREAKVEQAVKKLNENPQLLESYKWINTYIFQRTCVGCHSQLKGDSTEAFRHLVGAGWIQSGDPAQSLLIKRLRGLEGLQRMPLAAEPLPEQTIQYIESFIRAIE